jgi:aspartyl-tRNA synthetase
MTENGFYEIETPCLTKSTPEGARDFLVPSRLNPGTFYALPQSPQLFKQILMVAGFDKYFQIVRCFRDEDLRSDRQPEFTQIDIEMSFIDEDDIISLVEGLIKKVFKQVTGIDMLQVPFMRMKYADAMAKYGSDKPDLRFGVEINDMTETFKDTGFKVFIDTITKGGLVNAIKVPSNKFSREKMDKLVEYVKVFGAKGLAWVKITDTGSLESPILKFFSQPEQDRLKQVFDSQMPGTIFFVADPNKKVVFESLGNLRVLLANELGLIDKTKFCFLWVVDFPLFEWSDADNRLVAVHHPFTSPAENDLDVLMNSSGGDDEKLRHVKSRAYDIVLNGVELGGGSIRIHNYKVQQKILSIFKCTDTEIEDRFGFLIRALQYGAPPHGGLAIGFDRMMALLLGEDSIREVITFPKTKRGVCPLSNGPDVVSDKQLKELNIITLAKEKETH